MAAMAAGSSFQPASSLPGRNPVWTLPGMIVLTRILQRRRSSIIASVNPARPNLDALYAAPVANACLPAKLPMLRMNPPRCFMRTAASFEK